MTNIDKVSDEEIKADFYKKLVSSFLDLLVIGHFQEQEFSGYDVLEFIHKQIGVLLSSGTVYYTLYSMERDNLLVSTEKGKKRVFKATEKGLHRTRLLMDPNAASAFFESITGNEIT